ncbi:hypothetical protein BO94DRAFT_611737 [Aspergillus sclerotioniger CBS 115572]|uniref:Actin-like ATPase domain-containing protein n=1 Tax=Aspergillus sclerotioniger CBS 115572 TaxID=1450535 RepID=A0A317V523_9EURO|nr:hypothetical protein BO94DRAFT_611737 [Aspergillus sclerotioniger CBS 115572]PWY67967.1 hypothetical protein BO94DRAFT_611737 [Aspergillus sclerotioniger CBS 115572]
MASFAMVPSKDAALVLSNKFQCSWFAVAALSVTQPYWIDNDGLIFDLLVEGKRKLTMIGLLDPIIDKARGLIGSQQDAVASLCTGTKHIYVVGGGACIPYVPDAIRWHFQGPGMIVTVPHSPHLTVVQGAAMYSSREAYLSVHRCLQHVGFSCTKQYDDTRDGQADPRVANVRHDPFRGEVTSDGVATWVLEKASHQLIGCFLPLLPLLTRRLMKEGLYDDGYTNEQAFFADLKASGDTLKRSHAVYKCRSAVAPQRVDHNSAVHYCSIELDFTPLRLWTLPTFWRDGALMYRVRYVIETTVFASLNEIKFTATAFDCKLGTRTVVLPAP